MNAKDFGDLNKAIACQSNVLDPTYVPNNPIYEADLDVRLRDVKRAAEQGLQAIAYGMVKRMCGDSNFDGLKDGEFAIGNWIVRPRFKKSV